jgi:beta-glucosidase
LDPPDSVPYTKVGQVDPWTTPEHKALALKLTEESIVLLKNDRGLLPLDAKKIKTLAVVGSRADEVLLDWYSGTPPYAVTPLQGIQKRAGAGVRIITAAGDDQEAAVKAAKGADAVIVCVGNHPTADAPFGKCTEPTDGKEAVDRESIELKEQGLVRRMLEANPNTVVVLITSFPVAVPWIQKNAPAILHMTHNSQELGTALAHALFGDINPAGRLVQTWPVDIGQLPPMMDYNIRNGRTYMYLKSEPLYPFGFGLSYTTFAYSDLTVSASHLALDGTIEVSVKVRNEGKRDGDEVVQLYIARPGAGADRPRRLLRGFQRVAVKAGETRTVRLDLPASAFRQWNTEENGWVIVPGPAELQVGASSADIRLKTTIEISGK